MQKSRAVVVYKPQERNITPLEKICDEFNLNLHICDNGEELRKEFEKQGVKFIIVPLGLERGGRKAKEFAEIAADILQPEDSDLVIIYSTEGYSPDEWLGEPDPRCTRVYHNYARPQLLMADKGWEKTIDFLKEADSREILARNPFKHTVEIEFFDKKLNDTIWNTPFPSEAGFLLRSAFKDMAKIVVHTPRQGLSGSMGYVIEPFNPSGQKTKKYFAKIYPDQGKALKEYENFRDHVYPCFPARHYPHYDYLRRYSGIAYSVIVSEMVEGLDGKSTTLRDKL